MITFGQPLAFNLSPSSTTTSSTTISSAHLRSVSFSSAYSDNGSSFIIKPSPSSVSLNRSFRRPVILKNSSSSKFSDRFGEVAGGTAAECAAICCCWPCGLLDLLVTAAVKLPAGLVRRAYKKRRRRRLEKMRKEAALGLGSYKSSSSLDEDDKSRKEEWGIPVAAVATTAEFAAMEEEMWSKFHGTGFWRSPSQREREDRYR